MSTYIHARMNSSPNVLMLASCLLYLLVLAAWAYFTYLPLQFSINMKNWIVGIVWSGTGTEVVMCVVYLGGEKIISMQGF